MKNSLKLFLLNVVLLAAVAASATTFDKTSYYRSAVGKKAAALKTSLSGIIGNPDVVSYDGLIDAYKKTDTRADGYVRDWYSNTTHFRHGTDKAGSYKKEGDVYNREHSVPQSWFGKGSPMRSDIMHVIPTDGYVNNRRSSFPFGEVGSVTYQSNNGYSKLGSCKTAGYSGTVFEPNDEVKGDIARIYFYMVTCYESRCTDWSGVFTSSKYPGLEQWTLNMMMRWSKQDPIDDVERARNEAVMDVQGNRNPYVDFPGLEQFVWGDSTHVAFHITNYINPYDGTGGDDGGGDGGDGGQGGDDDDDDDDDDDGGGEGETPIPAGDGDYVRLTSAPTDWTGNYLVVYEAGKVAFNAGLASTDDSGNYIAVTIEDGAIAATEAVNKAALSAVRADGGGYYLLNSAGRYLGHDGKPTTLSDQPTAFVLTANGTESGIKSDSYTLRYNTSWKGFRFYTSGQQSVCLYRQVPSVDGIADLLVNGQQRPVPVFDLSGRRVTPLRPGLYIINGKKVIKQ